MNLWTYRRRFMLDGVDYRVDICTGLKTIESRLLRQNTEIARDFTDVLAPGGQRNHRLEFALADGRRAEIEAGYVNWVSLGIAVRIDGGLVHESHPGKTIRFPSVDTEKLAQQQIEQRAQWQRNKYSLAVDLGLGALFFVLAKVTDDLTFAALTTAAAGLLVVVVQRFVKVDLLGGLALFGVAMLLVSAAFSWFFDDEWAVMMKSTLLGVFVASLTLSDAAFNGGGYFGARLLRYMPQPMDARRLALGLGCLGLVMATVNWIFVEFTTKDTWLYYTTFGDFALSMALVLAVMRYAQIDPPP